MVLVGIIGILGMSITSLIGINDRLYLPPETLINESFGIGFPFAIIMIILITGENYFLNRIIIIHEENIKERTKEQIKTIENELIINNLKYCPSCGTEIIDKIGDFCSKCGSPLK